MAAEVASMALADASVHISGLQGIHRRLDANVQSLITLKVQTWCCSSLTSSSEPLAQP